MSQSISVSHLEIQISPKRNKFLQNPQKNICSTYGDFTCSSWESPMFRPTRCQNGHLGFRFVSKSNMSPKPLQEHYMKSRTEKDIYNVSAIPRSEGYDFRKKKFRFVFTTICFVEGLCFTYVICMYLHILVSNMISISHTACVFYH